MKQDKFTGRQDNTERNVFLLLMITILILYIAVPLYGVIRDEQQGDAIFRIEDSLSGAGKSLPDDIIDFFFGSKEIPVPVTQIFDLEGTVIYSDQTPYINGIVELMSTPRYTRTDETGYFIFRNVEAGEHTVNILDESGNIAASCSIEISIDRNAVSHRISSGSDGTYIIRIPVNVEVIEIQLVLKAGEDGSISGIQSVEVVGVLTSPSEQPEGPKDENPPKPAGLDLPEPPAPPGGNIPGTVTPGAISGGGSAGDGGGGAIPGPFHFSVYDRNVSFGSEAAHINIFGADKHIAPGKKGSYRFTIDNTLNSFNSLYTVEFQARDNLPEGIGIPVLYRLKAGNSYVAGDMNTWCNPDQLYQDRIVEGKSSVVYTLEWYWPPGENDNLYAELTRNAEYSYSLRIKVTAQQY